MMNQLSSQKNRQIRKNRDQKILFKNQRPPAEVARPLPGAILIHPALLVAADF
jgi:hypothetical protein